LSSGPLCANIGETTPSRKLVYNRGRRKDGKCLIANQRTSVQKAKARPKYRIQKFYLGPSAGGLQRSTGCLCSASGALCPWRTKAAILAEGGLDQQTAAVVVAVGMLDLLSAPYILTCVVSQSLTHSAAYKKNLP